MPESVCDGVKESGAAAADPSLAPRVQSGQIYRQDIIGKCGDKMLRHAVGAANSRFRNAKK
jgi:hypothetical protein